MAHRKPKRGDVKTTDGILLEVASQACQEVLMTDLRIQQAYDAWVQAHDLDRLTRRFTVWRTPEALAKAQAAIWGGPLTDDEGRHVEVDALAEILRGMGVPWPWVSPCLLTHCFPVYYVNLRRQTAGMPPLQMVEEAEMVSTATKGWRPSAEDIESLRRQVDWWYRRKIKDPKDELKELEAKELARTGQTTIARRHSTVLQGIQRVESLLGVWDGYEIGLQVRQEDFPEFQ